MLAWIDIETTDLNPDKLEVLEVACIVTRDDLTEVARYHAVVYSPIARKVVDRIPEYPTSIQRLTTALLGRGIELDQFVVEMHLKNGLWQESVRGLALETVDRDLAAFITQHSDLEDTGNTRIKPQLAGSSVWFDREVLRRRLPHAFGQLHYRNVDVSTLIELSTRFWPGTYSRGPRSRKMHRAMPDLEDSVELTRYYVQTLGPTAPPVPMAKDIPVSGPDGRRTRDLTGDS